MPRPFVTSGSITIALLGVFLFALRANSQATAEASDDEILKGLAPELNDVQLLTMQGLTQEQIDNIGNTPEVDRRFEGDFDSDGRPDLALFGSYAGGTFVLLASRDQTVWHRSGWVSRLDGYRIRIRAVSADGCVGVDIACVIRSCGKSWWLGLLGSAPQIRIANRDDHGARVFRSGVGAGHPRRLTLAWT